MSTTGSTMPSFLQSSFRRLYVLVLFLTLLRGGKSTVPIVEEILGVLPIDGDEGEGSIRTLALPFGLDAGDSKSTEPCEDCSSEPISLIKPLPYFGETYNTVYHNTNGHVSFEAPYIGATPRMLPSAGLPALIAPYWADISTEVDGNGGGGGGGTLYSRVSEDPFDLEKSSALVRASFPETGRGETFQGDALLVFTWDSVSPHYVSEDWSHNTFQLAVVYNAHEVWLLFSYKQLEFYYDYAWFTVNGFNDPEGVYGTQTSWIRSGTDMVALLTSTNCGLQGTHAYPVPVMNDDKPSNPGTPLPLPMPFGALAGDAETSSGGPSIATVSLEFPMKFLGSTQTAQVYQSIHGTLSFQTYFSIPFTQLLPSLTIPPTLAAYWISMDPDTSGNVWLRYTTQQDDLDKALSVVAQSGYDPQANSFVPKAAVVSTWDQVAHRMDATRNNTVQATLLHNDMETWVILAYRNLGFYSYNGVNAVIGANGVAGLTGSTVHVIEEYFAMQELMEQTNCGEAGTYVYRISGDTVEDGAMWNPPSLPGGPDFVLWKADSGIMGEPAVPLGSLSNTAGGLNGKIDLCLYPPNTEFTIQAIPPTEEIVGTKKVVMKLLAVSSGMELFKTVDAHSPYFLTANDDDMIHPVSFLSIPGKYKVVAKSKPNDTKWKQRIRVGYLSCSPPPSS